MKAAHTEQAPQRTTQHLPSLLCTIERMVGNRCFYQVSENVAIRWRSDTTSFSVVVVRARGTEVPADATRAKALFGCQQSSVKWYDTWNQVQRLALLRTW